MVPPSFELVVLSDELIDIGFAGGQALLDDVVHGGADLPPGAPEHDIVALSFLQGALRLAPVRLGLAAILHAVRKWARQ